MPNCERWPIFSLRPVPAYVSAHQGPLEHFMVRSKDSQLCSVLVGTPSGTTFSRDFHVSILVAGPTGSSLTPWLPRVLAPMPLVAARALQVALSRTTKTRCRGLRTRKLRTVCGASTSCCMLGSFSFKMQGREKEVALNVLSVLDGPS